MRNPIGPRRSHLRRKIVGLILAYGLLLWAVGSGVGAEAAESVLVLHSYHADLPWTRGLEQGIREGLAHRPGMVLHVEFLDQIRYPPHTIFPVMETLLRAKFDLEIFPIERSTDAFADRR